MAPKEKEKQKGKKTGYGARFVLPVPAEQLEQCRAEMQRRGLESLDEGFVATVKAFAAARVSATREFLATHGFLQLLTRVLCHLLFSALFSALFSGLGNPM